LKPFTMHTSLRHGLPLVAAGVLALSTAETLAGPKRSQAPLFDGLGNHHHAITTDAPLAQRYFNQGVVLLYGFNHEEAIRSFRAAAQADPDCAMAYWGVAYALGPNINRPMPDSAVPEAWQALQDGLARLDKVSPREQAYLQALAKRYEPEPVADRSRLDRAYADAMREVTRKHPDDLDAATLFVEAVMDLMPWDYYQLDRKPKPEMVEAIDVLRSVLRRNPDHPGANHFLIHALEAGPTPEDALFSADRLRALNLQAAHLIHMPSHIYVRTGRYFDAIDVNAEAARVDRRYIAQCRAQGFYPSVYYPHNEHFLWFANLMAGRAKDAIKVARRIEELELDARCGPYPLIEAPRFRHLTYITLARFGRWEELAREKPPAEEFPLDLAFWHYARAMGEIAQGDVASAAERLTEVRRIGELQALKDMDSPVFPATMVYAVAEAVLAGKVAIARDQISVGLDHLKRAVSLEDSIPYMEPPFWTTPTRQTLGAALLEAGMAADAEGVFRADLDRNPRNGWSLYGLQQALKQQRQDFAADAVGREFAQSWSRADSPLKLEWY
jgi:tetratricopeptide (TPR) repeat protein